MQRIGRARRPCSPSTGCRSSRSSRRAPTSTSPCRCASRGERRVRGGGVLAGHGRAGCRGGVPGPRAANVLTSYERAPRPQRCSLRRRLDTGGGSGDERPAGRHRPRRARGAHQQVGVQGALDRPARAHRGAGDPHRDHSAGPGAARHPGRCPRCGGDACAEFARCRDGWRGAERGGSRCVPRTARSRVTARCPARRPPERRGSGPCNELLDVTGVPCFADYGAIGTVSDDDDATAARSTSSVDWLRARAPTSRSRWACGSGSTLRVSAMAGRVGNDRAAGRQRSGGGRSLRTSRDLRHRRSW